MTGYSGIIYVVATVNVKPAEIEKFTSAVSDIMGPTRTEDGNISYDCQQSLDTTSEFVFLETWGSQAALDAHLATVHMRSFFSQIGSFLTAPPAIKVYRRLYKAR